MTEDTQGVNPQAEHPPVSKSLVKNPISLIGIALAAVAFANIVFLVLIDVLASQPSPYIGILAYMVAPGFLVAGFDPDSTRHRDRAATPAAPNGRPTSVSAGLI